MISIAREELAGVKVIITLKRIPKKESNKKYNTFITDYWKLQNLSKYPKEVYTFFVSFKACAERRHKIVRSLV